MRDIEPRGQGGARADGGCLKRGSAMNDDSVAAWRVERCQWQQQRGALSIKHVGNINILILLKICAEKSLFCIRKCEAKTHIPPHTHKTPTHTPAHAFATQTKQNGADERMRNAKLAVVVVVVVVAACHDDVCNDKRC